MKYFRKKVTTVISLLVLGVIAPLQVSAQNDSVTINLEKALEIALCDNPDIKVADRTIKIQDYAKKGSIMGLFPTLSVTAAEVKNLLVATMSMSMGDQVINVKMGRPYNTSLTATTALPLVAPQLWKTISLNEEQIDLAKEQARESKVNTIAAVKKAYYDMLLARDSYDVFLATYAVSEQNARNTRAMYDQGMVSEFDKLTAEVQLSNLKPQLITVQNGLKLAEMQLKILMGLDIAEPLKFEGKLSDDEQDLFNDLMLLKSDTSLADNSTLRQLDSQRRQLVLAEKINKLGYIPTLALQLTGGYSAMPDEFNPFKAPYFGSSALTLAFSWNIWDGGGRLTKTRQSKLQLENLDIQREHIQRQLELAITNSLNGIERAAEQVVATKESVNNANKALIISQKRYEVGSGTMIEMNNSESQLLSARLQYVQSVYDFLNNRTELEKTLGKVVMGK